MRETKRGGGKYMMLIQTEDSLDWSLNSFTLMEIKRVWYRCKVERSVICRGHSTDKNAHSTLFSYGVKVFKLVSWTRPGVFVVPRRCRCFVHVCGIGR